MSGKLIIVGTPIGNLNDFSQRGIEALSNCDFIAAEDTRVTLKLLNRFEIKRPLVSYYEHNKEYSGEKIISRIQNGEICSLVSDAGMPIISDPGYELVRTCREQGIEIDIVPGPTAFATALCLSGMDNKRFTFEGFLSTNKTDRFEHLNSLLNETRTMIFYEAPHKLQRTLADFEKTFSGDRKISICRELTKIHQEVLNFTLSEAIEYYNENSPKGEFVIIVEGTTLKPETEISFEDAVKYAKSLVSDGMKKNEAAKTVALESHFKKSDIYKELI